MCSLHLCLHNTHTQYTRCDQNVPRLNFTRLWVHFGTPLFAGWCPRIPWDKGWSQRAFQSFVSFGWRESCTCALLFSPLNRRNGVCLTTNRKQSQMKTLWGNHHGRRGVGLRVWPGDTTSIFAVEVCRFPEAKESAPGAVKSQSHAHCFLWYGGHCSLWVCSTRPNCKLTVLSTSFETSDTCCFSQEATETDGGGLGATSRQCTSTNSTRHPGIFGKSWHSCRSPPLTWLRVTFGCSPN